MSMMKVLPCLVALFAIQCSSANVGGSLALKFVEFTTKHACVCSESTGICRCFVHVVFTATPKDFTNKLIGGGSYATSNASDAVYMPGSDTRFERHLVTGICNCNATYCDYANDCDNTTGTAQMWNWGWEDTATIDMYHAGQLPKTICPKVWMTDLNTGSTAEFSVSCLDMPVTVLEKPASLQPVLTAINAFSSAATLVDSQSTGLSRSNLHIVFTIAPSDPTHLLVGGGMMSFDRGATWESTGTTVYYEQHIDLSGERYYQAWQFDYDRVHKTSDAAVGSEVCYKVWLTDTNTEDTVWLNATSEADMHCMKVCRSLIQFHWPHGYCPEEPQSEVVPLLA